MSVLLKGYWVIFIFKWKGGILVLSLMAWFLTLLEKHCEEMTIYRFKWAALFSTDPLAYCLDSLFSVDSLVYGLSWGSCISTKLKLYKEERGWTGLISFIVILGKRPWMIFPLMITDYVKLPMWITTFSYVGRYQKFSVIDLLPWELYIRGNWKRLNSKGRVSPLPLFLTNTHNPSSDPSTHTDATKSTKLSKIKTTYTYRLL